MLLPILLLVAQVDSGAPEPQPSPALKEIGHVHSSTLCTALHRNLIPAVEGLRVNDAMIGRGQTLLVKTSKDAAAYAADASLTDGGAGDPFAQESGANAGSASATGGGSAASEMDAFQLGILTQNLAKNLEKVETLLDDMPVVSGTAATDDQRALALARARLQDVVARQRASLNILSGTAETNAVNDLKSRRDVIPYEHCMTCSQTTPYAAISAPESLAAAAHLTQQSETAVTPAVLPIVDACR